MDLDQVFNIKEQLVKQAQDNKLTHWVDHEKCLTFYPEVKQTCYELINDQGYNYITKKQLLTSVIRKYRRKVMDNKTRH